jgi:hypothetical protein
MVLIAHARILRLRWAEVNDAQRGGRDPTPASTPTIAVAIDGAVTDVTAVCPSSFALLERGDLIGQLIDLG